jgi:membrane protease YdiL (CAAX protease family)
MASDGFLTVIAVVLNALFVLGGAYIYLSLARQIGARPDDDTIDPDHRTFGLPEAVVALALATLFAVNAAFSNASTGKVVLTARDLAANLMISFGLVLFVYALLRLRRIDVNSLAGFSRLGFARTLLTGGILLFAAYPLIFVADLVTQRVLRVPSTRQTIVEMFNGSQTIQERALIIILAVAVAPLVEEFVFRFFFYGVLRRYFGRAVGLLVNALLFAAVHAHIPSAAPLFVLGSCFTLAFEWSGSILVPMTMHAMFNSLTLVALAFPDLLPQ